MKKKKLSTQEIIAWGASRCLADLPKYSFGAVVAWAIYLSIKELAGKTTSADFFIKAILDAGEACLVNNKAVLIAIALLVIWAFLERRLRYRKTKEMAKRIAKLEKRINPNRKTSGLDETGKTNPRDL